jgi:CRP-like cAMP-binding protein
VEDSRRPVVRQDGRIPPANVAADREIGRQDSTAVTRVLRRCALFRDLDPDGLTSVLRQAHECAVAQGRFYFRQGEGAAEVYVLVHGKVRLVRQEADGGEIILRFVGPGEPFGYVEVLGRAPHFASAYAVEDSGALAWDAAALLGAMQRYPSIALNGYRLTAEEVEAAWNRLRDALTQSVEQRVGRALLRLACPQGQLPRDHQPVEIVLSHQDVAELVGTTLYTVSRVLSRWKRDGMVSVRRGRVIVHKPGRLAEIVGESWLPPARRP